ncbi:VirD4-like conjugal transfer protein, CD1115 family [Paraeggerthella hominis]|uniref:VirD4-like conjugal transfer protein, CD1115 family n=1 Tax=Paraeggerthella hominis TaxID=2897351 RepID=UPI003F6F6146
MKVGKAGLIAATVLSLLAFAAADVYASCLMGFPQPLLGHLNDALARVPQFLTDGSIAKCAEPAGLAAGFVAACAVWMVWAYSLMRQGNFRHGEEHGSSRWGTRVEGKRFMNDKDESDNIIFTENYGLSLSKNRYNRKLNRSVLVIGGSGSGKTSSYVLPNMLQMNCSLFLTDPKGTLLSQTGGMYVEQKWDMRVFNLVDMDASMHFNPMVNVETETDILVLVECLIANTKGEENTTGDPFWDDAERLLYTALFAYLKYHCPKRDQSLSGLITLLGLAEAREDDESYLSPLDMLFYELETGKRYVADPVSVQTPFNAELRDFAADASGGYRWVQVEEPISPEDDFALRSYNAFKVAASKTLKSIIISCNVRVQPMTVPEVRRLLEYDEMHIETMGDPNQRSVIFAVPSDTRKNLNFLFAIMMWQTLDVLCLRALKKYGGELPTPVHFMFDEFANIGRIPDIETMISVVRSRNISMSIILQSMGQLKDQYKDKAQTIIDNCDTTLFLGGKSTDTNKQISEMIGKETVSVTTFNESRGANRSSTKNYNLIERDLMQASEVGRLDRDKAIVMLAGAYPLLDEKFDVSTHENAKLIYNPYAPSGEGRSEPFDVEGYLADKRAGS